MRSLRAKGNASDSDRPVALQMKPEALNELPNSCSFSPSLSLLFLLQRLSLSISGSFTLLTASTLQVEAPSPLQSPGNLSAHRLTLSSSTLPLTE